MQRSMIALAVAALLASCGGGNPDPVEKQAAAIEEAARASGLTGAEARRRALYVVPFTSELSAATTLMNTVERVIPDIFPPGAQTRSLGTWWYRYYADTGIYLAVIDWRVFLLGGPFGPAVRDMGAITDYITFPEVPAQITTARLATCPDSGVVEAPNFYTCTQGSMAGAQLFDATKPCSFKISADGTTVLESGGQRLTITPATFGRALWFKSSGSSSYFSLTLYSASTAQPSVQMDIDSVQTAANFFQVGGVVHVSARQLSPEASLSCAFNVPRT